MLKKVITYFLIIFWLLINSSFLYAQDFDLIKVQSWLEKIDSQIYKCKKEACKINLIVDWYADKGYLCVWDFWWGVFKTKATNRKCNPGYVDYETWEYNIDLKVYKDDDLENIFRQENIKIINWEIQKQEENIEQKFYSDEVNLYSNESSISKKIDYSELLPQTIIWEIEKEEKELIYPEIIIQSGLEYLTWTIYKCKKKECKINLTSSWFSDKNYNCLWNFSGGNFKTKDTDKKCNPWYVDYGTWEYEIELKVIDKQDDSRVFETRIFVENLEEESNSEEVIKPSLEWQEENSKIIEKSVTSSRKTEIINQKPKAKITLQWRMAKYKELVWNKLICEWVDKCSVNFSGEESEDDGKLNYFWDYWNWIKFEKSNPKSVYFEKGKYKVSLKVVDEFWLSDTDYFYIEVVPKNTISEENIDKNIFWNLKIAGVLANTSGRDDREFIEIENKSSYKLNLKWLIISDASKSYKIKENFYFYPFSKKRFYKSTTKLSLWNKSDLVKLSYNNVVLDEIKWDFDVPDNFLLTHKNINLDFEKVFVERVIDGDTIKVKFENNRFATVRLLWVDTPETKDPRKEVQFYGVEASEFTKKSLEWKYIYLEYDKSNLSWKYGRLLAYVYLDKQRIKNFNKILVENWYARVYIKYPFKYEKYFLKAQIKAKKQKLGIWQNSEIKKQLLEEIKQEKQIIEKQNLFEIDKINFVKSEYKKFDKKLNKFLDYDVAKIPKDIWIKKWFNWKVVEYTANKKEIKNKETKQKSLKKSIKYKVSKNKKAFRISGYSYKYKNILINFQNKDYYLKTNKNNKFELNLLKVIPWDFYANFYWIDKSWNKVFLKKSRKIKLSSEYVNSIWKLKKKWRKKKQKIKKVLNSTKNYIANDIKNKSEKIVNIFDFKEFILKVLIWIVSILFLFLILIRKKLLQ